MSEYKKPVCRGCWALGNNCKTCERCIETKPMTDQPNSSNDLLPCPFCKNPNFYDSGDSAPSNASDLAKRFHETYERLAPSMGYETREESAVPWEEVPENNKRLMIAVCEELLPSIPSTERVSNASKLAKDTESFIADAQNQTLGTYCVNAMTLLKRWLLQNTSTERVSISREDATYAELALAERLERQQRQGCTPYRTEKALKAFKAALEAADE